MFWVWIVHTQNDMQGLISYSYFLCTASSQFIYILFHYMYLVIAVKSPWFCRMWWVIHWLLRYRPIFIGISQSPRWKVAIVTKARREGGTGQGSAVVLKDRSWERECGNQTRPVVLGERLAECIGEKGLQKSWASLFSWPT